MIIPFGHDKMEAQRFPYITLGIVILNTLLYLITFFAAPNTEQQAAQRETEFSQYYYTHPYLKISESTFNKLSKEQQKQMKQIKQLDIPVPEVSPDFTNSILEETSDTSGQPKKTPESMQKLQEQQRQKEQDELDRLAQAFEESLTNSFYEKYGYIPARGGFFTMFSSMFLHGGFFHLLFNMLFLWLSGCNIEDLWGRIVYPIFYLLGGIIATQTHAMIAPDSAIPLVGASGAIAAAMGAFMVRLYNVKIRFFYALAIGFKFKVGQFSAPAYLMLPLWLLQQLWDAVSSQQGGGGVAVWAHIGGFAFGAIVAILFKVTGFESKVLAPAIEKKVVLVDESLASGVEKLREGNVEGAIQDLKQAIQTNPNDPLAHNELAKAYFQKGEKDLAQREFKRSVYIYIKREDMEEAVNEYLDLSPVLPSLLLDPPQQLKIAAAIEARAGKVTMKSPHDQESLAEQRTLYDHAMSAYKNMLLQYQRQKRPLDTPDALKALTRYADLCATHLERYQDAAKAYQTLLKSAKNLSPEEKQAIQTKVDQAIKNVAMQSQKAVLLKQEQETAAKKTAETKKAVETKQPARSNISLQQRMKLVPDVDAPGKYQILSIDPLDAHKVLPAPGGLDLKRPREEPIPFDRISVISVFQLNEAEKPSSSSPKAKRMPEPMEDSQEVISADLFVIGQSRPYRIASNKIAYAQFFSNIQMSSLDNFRQFILYVISKIDSVYVDQGTIQFLKTGKPKAFNDNNDLKLHEKMFWKQLCGAVRFHCDRCYEVYWIDGNKIPENGARTKCAKCGHPIAIQRPKLPQPLAKLPEPSDDEEP